MDIHEVVDIYEVVDIHEVVGVDSEDVLGLKRIVLD